MADNDGDGAWRWGWCHGSPPPRRRGFPFPPPRGRIELTAPHPGAHRRTSHGNSAAGPRRLCGQTLHRPLSNRRGITTSRAAKGWLSHRSIRPFPVAGMRAPSTTTFFGECLEDAGRVRRVRAATRSWGMPKAPRESWNNRFRLIEPLRVRQRRARGVAMGSKLLAAHRRARRSARWRAHARARKHSPATKAAIAFYRKNGFSGHRLRPVCLFQRRPRAAARCASRWAKSCDPAPCPARRFAVCCSKPPPRREGRRAPCTARLESAKMSCTATRSTS